MKSRRLGNVGRRDRVRVAVNERGRSKSRPKLADAGCGGTARQRELYGPKHIRRRRELAKRIERGEFFICPRCSMQIGPDQDWDLGHDDWDPTRTRPEHRWCNRAAANQVKTSRKW
jgi:hypothetical protein